MLLVHQAGSVKIGEVVRYTVTYTPSADRILPSPEFLFLRIKNTCAIALRAAFVHGPYTLSVAAYPSHFDPNKKFENPRRYGVPEFEPMLKAGGTWNCHLVVPDNIRQTAGEGTAKYGVFGKGPAHDGESVSWIIEVTSQVIFSTSAAVHYEILLARDEKSLNLGSVVPVIGGQAQAPQPGRVSDFQQSAGAVSNHPAQPKGVFSRAIHLKVEDTASLWNTPHLPGWDDDVRGHRHQGADAPVDAVKHNRRSHESEGRPRKQKKVHLVVLTHGLHSNLGADMLFMKESIDAGVKKAKADLKARRAKERAARDASSARTEPESNNDSTDTNEGDKTPTGVQHDNVDNGKGEKDVVEEEDEDEDEEVIVRGFSGNATKTEKGIKYLGKRLAKYVLSMTFPDQIPFHTSKTASEAIVQALSSNSQKNSKEATTPKTESHRERLSAERKRPYQITKISFIAHSLGGLVQTFAIAYIQKHCPNFFDQVEPINFITLASPFLGLNHENPLYVKFALDFGLVGRTGQDLGLTWRAPTIARSGWGAIVGNLGENAHRRVYGEHQPESKPLLRILPTGPAHTALKKFRNRTVYSNVVNDGIVPLRTSCLLFLDWQGLGRVEKARREVGLVETVAAFGWAEITGANVTSPRVSPWLPEEDNKAEEAPDSTGASTPTGVSNCHEVPQPPTNVMLEDDQQSLRGVASPFHENGSPNLEGLKQSSTANNGNPFTGFLNLFRKEDRPKSPSPPSPKLNKIYQRSQTLKSEDFASDSTRSTKGASKVSTGNDVSDGPEGLSAPPKTTFFEAAGDLLNPKLPSIEYLIDPSKRPRTIFHDRIYHPSDIPPPPMKRRSAGNALGILRKSNSRSASTSTQNTGDSSEVSSPTVSPTAVRQEDSSLNSVNLANPDNTTDPADMIDSSQMKVEEKIARAYHRDLSWRKVLVKLEPDAHNNLIVRRMFANAFGWPVVHHLVESHFSDAANLATKTEDRANIERAKKPSEPPTSTGREINPDKTRSKGITSEDGATGEQQQDDTEARDVLHDLPRSSSSPKANSPRGEGEHTQALGSTMLPSPASSPRPRLYRHDSMTWSERDWLESGDDTDDDFASYGGHSSPFGSTFGSSHSRGSPTDTSNTTKDQKNKGTGQMAWNWTEKIVGRGALAARRRSKSPTTGTATVTASSLLAPSPAVEPRQQQRDKNGSHTAEPGIGPDIPTTPTTPTPQSVAADRDIERGEEARARQDELDNGQTGNSRRADPSTGPELHVRMPSGGSDSVGDVNSP
ncbi:putative serine esterase (DUF676) domain containing protein [Naviculisporaceae sp. PSN 640]